MKNSVPLWIIAVCLSIVVGIILLCAGGALVCAVLEEWRREELLEREPWRNHLREPYRYAP